MRNKIKWETKSLEWIHKVREEMDSEITQSGMSLAEWIKSRGKIDIDSICSKLGLQNLVIMEKNARYVKPRGDQ